MARNWRLLSRSLPPQVTIRTNTEKKKKSTTNRFLSFVCFLIKSIFVISSGEFINFQSFGNPSLFETEKHVTSQEGGSGESQERHGHKVGS